jgi:hypothetical protein
MLIIVLRMLPEHLTPQGRRSIQIGRTLPNAELRSRAENDRLK